MSWGFYGADVKGAEFISGGLIHMKDFLATCWIFEVVVGQFNIKSLATD